MTKPHTTEREKKLTLKPWHFDFICNEAFCDLLQDGKKIGNRMILLTDDEVVELKMIIMSAVSRNEKLINSHD